MENPRWLLTMALYHGSLCLPGLVIATAVRLKLRSLPWILLAGAVALYLLFNRAEHQPFVVIVCSAAGGLIGLIPFSGRRLGAILAFTPVAALISILTFNMPGNLRSRFDASFYESPTARLWALLFIAGVHLLLFTLGAGFGWLLVRLFRSRRWQIVMLAGIAVVLMDSSWVLSADTVVIQVSGLFIGVCFGRVALKSSREKERRWAWLIATMLAWDVLNEGVWQAFVVARDVGVNTYQWALTLLWGVALSYGFMSGILLFPETETTADGTEIVPRS
jgi:hypothetical protein